MRRWKSLVAVALGFAGACDPGSSREGMPDREFVGRETCQACHAQEVEAYSGSDHDLAMDHATAETVLGDFADVTLVAQGVETGLSVEDGRFLVSTAGPDGSTQQYQVAYTFGARPLQQYLVELDRGHLQRLPWSWDARPASEGGQRWFHIYGDDPIGPDDVLHWTRSSQNWNRMCADCHSTNLAKGYDSPTDAYQTTWSEIDVSCEACHGPASRHLDWANTGTAQRRPPNLGFPLRLTDSDSAVWVRPASARTASRSAPRTDRVRTEQCARCHAHRIPIAEFEHGERFDDMYRLSLPREPLYYPDGQVREEVFVYGSFLQSKMYRAGVDCADCHDPHSLELRAEGNALCTRCHSAEEFDAPQHHRHTEPGPASACVSCHMPSTTFMQVDARRDHGFTVPHAPLADEPNVCASCHNGRDAEWVRTTLDQWSESADESARDRATRTIWAASRGVPSAHGDLLRLAFDSAIAPLVRATAVSYLDRYPSQETVQTIQSATLDADPTVRARAAGAVAFLQPEQRLPLVEPLLADSSRLVRIAAARSLAAIPPAAVAERRRPAFAEAIAEYLTSLELNADDPAANVELGDYFREQGRFQESETAYRRALSIEAGFVGAYVNLADLYRTSNREGDAYAVLIEGRERSAPSAVLEYAVGLAEVRADRIAEGIEAFETATRLAPNDDRFVLALGLALRAIGQPRAAAEVLEASLGIVPSKRGVASVLVELYRELGRDEDALRLEQDIAAPQSDESASIPPVGQNPR